MARERLPSLPQISPSPQKWRKNHSWFSAIFTFFPIKTHFSLSFGAQEIPIFVLDISLKNLLSTFSLTINLNINLYKPSFMKKLFILMSCFFMNLCMQAADGETFTAKTPEGIAMTFRIISEENKTASVGIENGASAISSSTSGTVTIPHEVTYNEAPYIVTTIGLSAFYRCKDVISIQIPNSITTIGQGAFYGCTSLKRIEIPNSVITINDNAFRDCIKLTSVTIPETVKKWGSYVFAGCRGLESIHIPSNTIMNASFPFSFCTSLRNITFANNVTSIGEGTFSGCTALKTIDIPSNIKTIEKDAFKDCKNLASVTFHEGLEVIEDAAFNDCDAITSITIPNSVVSIGSMDLSSNVFGTFAGCDNLKTVVLNNSLTSIPDFAFYNCKNLASINMPTNLKEIGDNAFHSCSNLAGNMVLPNNIAQIGSGAFAWTNISSIKIPNSVTHFASSALHGNLGIKKVIVSSLKQWCQHINFGSGGHGDIYGTTVRSSGLLHFADLYVEGHENTPIKDVVIPDGVKHINTDAFYDASITSVEIPSSVESIYNSAFEYCNQLKTVKFHEGLKSIGNDAFAHCTALENLKLPDGLVELGAAFYQCTGLKTVEIPNSVTTAYYGYSGVFTGCSSMESVKMGTGMTTIPSNMFAMCTNLHFFEIPNSVTQIASNAFSGCKQLNTIIFPNSITTTQTNYYGDTNSFQGCDNLTQVIVPDFNIADWCGKYLVGGPLRYSHHLYDTEGNDLIVDAVIPEGVTKVTEYAFLGCESMTSLTLPSTITSIGSYSFGDCSYLTSVTCKMKIPCTISNTTFYQLPNCTLYIPHGTKNAYIAAGWNESIFKGGIVEYDTTTPGDANGDGGVNVFDVTTTVNHILGSGNEGLDFDAADVNGDGTVNVFDVTKMVNIILGVDAGAKKREE